MLVASRAPRGGARPAGRSAAARRRTPKPSRARAAARPSGRRRCGPRRRRSSGGAGERDHPAQHVDEQARERQVRPGRVGGDVEEHDEALAALVGGDDRRAVGERGPGLVGEVAVGLGEDLAADAEIGRHGQTEERALAGEGREGARRVPGQACRRDCGRRGAGAPARDRRCRRQAASRRSAGAAPPRSTKSVDAGERLAVEARRHRRGPAPRPARRAAARSASATPPRPSRTSA